MRRLVVELGVRDAARVLPNRSLEKIMSLEVLSFLKSTPEEVALICRVQFKDVTTKMEEVFTDKAEEVQLLEQDERGYICFFKRKLRRVRDTSPLSSGGYLSIPYEIDNERIKVTFLGNAKEVRGFLRSLDDAGFPYKVRSLMDAKFSPASPIGLLTDKQRRVILAALSLGYYDVPRRVSSEELASRLNIREATLVMHRRKAEKRLLAALVKES